MSKRRMHLYSVWYSSSTRVRVQAYSPQGARNQAWAMFKGFKYGWSKADFLKNATVKRLN